jgi:hypothetical protein
MKKAPWMTPIINAWVNSPANREFAEAKVAYTAEMEPILKAAYSSKTEWAEIWDEFQFMIAIVTLEAMLGAKVCTKLDFMKRMDQLPARALKNPKFGQELFRQVANRYGNLS